MQLAMVIVVILSVLSALWVLETSIPTRDFRSVGLTVSVGIG